MVTGMSDAAKESDPSPGARHVVVTVHGIRTFGGWQARLAALLREAAPGCEVRSYKFNYFSALAFWFPPTRSLVVRRFAREMDRLGTRGNIARLDVVAHSFGTHVVAWGLRRAQRAPRVHTLVLSGSVLKATHTWDDLIPSRVGRLVNECGLRDGILILSQLFVPLTGMAGRVGFVGLLGPDFTNRHFDFGHSGYFEGPDGKPGGSFMHVNWVPLLTGDGPVPDIDQRVEATPLSGVQLWLLQWADPAKAAVLMTPIALAFTLLLGLWADAAMTRDRLEAATDLIRAAANRGQTLRNSDAEVIAGALDLPLGTSRVLWVDDYPGNNAQERAALGRWNVCFTNVRSTAEAVRELGARPGAYSLVISDWGRDAVPEQSDDSGEATGRAVATLSPSARPPLIFYVSARALQLMQNRTTDLPAEIGRADDTAPDDRNPYPQASDVTVRAATRFLFGAVEQTDDPFRLFSASLGELAKGRGIRDAGRKAGRMSALLASGAAWVGRQFSDCHDR